MLIRSLFFTAFFSAISFISYAQENKSVAQEVQNEKKELSVGHELSVIIASRFTLNVDALATLLTLVVPLVHFCV